MCCGDEGKMPENMEIIFTESGLERAGQGEDGAWRWICRICLVLLNPGHLNFCDLIRKERQSISITDSTGRELPPLEFDLGGLNSYLTTWEVEPEVNRKIIKGVCSGLPSPGSEWVRVKGSLRVLMNRVMESPVYELPLQAGASSFIPLPGRGEEGEGNVNDVVSTEDRSTGTLYFRRFEWLEEGGKKVLSVEIGLDVDGVFSPSGIQLLDDKGGLLGKVSLNRVPVPSEDSGSWTAEFKFSPPEGMDGCRIQLRYRTAPEYVSVPVDATFGLGGEIRGKNLRKEEKTSRKKEGR